MRMLISYHGGMSGFDSSYPALRRDTATHYINATCLRLAQQLRIHNMSTVDYMTIDTEGSEFSIMLDFPWRQFEVGMVQVEVLDEIAFPSMAGNTQRIVCHMQRRCYSVRKMYTVAADDTYDLIFVRNATCAKDLRQLTRRELAVRDSLPCTWRLPPRPTISTPTTSPMPQLVADLPAREAALASREAALASREAALATRETAHGAILSNAASLAASISSLTRIVAQLMPTRTQ